VTDNIPGYGKRVVPVTGQVLYQGSPAAGAEVVFRHLDPVTHKPACSSRGRVEDDGSFRLTS
jgi:hypothetical protein